MPIARAIYFVLFAALAFLLPFLSLYYQQELGLSGSQIGLLTGIAPILSLVGGSLWGAYADASRRHKMVLLLAIAGVWFSVWGIFKAPGFWFLLAAVVAYALLSSPVVPIIDNSVMTLLGERRDRYGLERVWGSVGWGVAALFAGLLIKQLGLHWAFYGFFILYGLLFFIALRFPVPEVSIASQFWSGVRQLATNGRWIIFLLVALVEGMSLAIFLNFLFLLLSDMGSSPTIMSWSLTVATLSEIPIFLLGHKLLRRWSPVQLLTASMLLTAVRAFLYAGMTAPWQILPISLLHGPTFAIMWTAGVAYSAQTAPKGLGTTALAVFGGMTFGLGSALGSFSGGWLYQHVGGTAPFVWAGISAILAVLPFIWMHRRSLLQPNSGRG
jgi:PPP family 3-phenylpropionic acid transporter